MKLRGTLLAMLFVYNPTILRKRFGAIDLHISTVWNADCRSDPVWIHCYKRSQQVSVATVATM